ncbi:MAG TPA: hypothetical protein VFS03_09890 [Microvirga sp.]|nr:hypothetical protein [Microvirga sp.]
MTHLRRLPLLILALAPLPAAAQDAEPDPAVPALVVRAPDPRTRQERLLRRMEAADDLMRHIYIHCGGVERPGDGAPFEPLARLNAAR